MNYTSSVGPIEFKNFMAEVPTCVAIVATQIDTGIQACTVSSLTSFDVETPGIMVVLQKHSRTLDAIKRSSVFSANILSQDQTSLAQHFSSKTKKSDSEESQFFEFSQLLVTPFLKSCQGVIFCKLERVLDMEHASVIFGRVIGLEKFKNDLPLVYFKRKYFTLGDSLP